MGSVKNSMLGQAQRNYVRNRHYHERQKLLDRIRRYSDNPGFVAKLQDELIELEQEWKNRNKKAGHL